MEKEKNINEVAVAHALFRLINEEGKKGRRCNLQQAASRFTYTLDQLKLACVELVEMNAIRQTPNQDKALSPESVDYEIVS